MNPKVTFGGKWVVIDDLLPNFEEYYKEVKVGTFKDEVAQGRTYKDICTNVSANPIFEALRKEGRNQGDFETEAKDFLSFLRAYRTIPDFKRDMWIHTDQFFSEYIGIFFVQSTPFPQDDGFLLWKNKDLNTDEWNQLMQQEEVDIINQQTLDPDKWELIQRFEFKPNRLVIAPASMFHSTNTFSNYETSLDTCRIVHILFFNQGPV